MQTSTGNSIQQYLSHIKICDNVKSKKLGQQLCLLLTSCYEQVTEIKLKKRVNKIIKIPFLSHLAQPLYSTNNGLFRFDAKNRRKKKTNQRCFLVSVRKKKQRRNDRNVWKNLSI